MVVFLRVVGALLLIALLVYVGLLSRFIGGPVDAVAAIRSGLDSLFAMTALVLAALCFGLAGIARRFDDLEGLVGLVLKRVSPEVDIPTKPKPPVSPTGRPWE